MPNSRPHPTVTPTEYSRRHVVVALNSTRGLIVMVIASQADSAGRARTIQRYIAEDIGKSLATVERAMRWLLADGSGPVLLKAAGRGYILAGYAEHDSYRCGHPECEADFTFELSSDKKRAVARERQRRRRDRLREAAQRP